MRRLAGIVAGVALAAPAFASEIGAAVDLPVAGADVIVLGEVHDNPAHHDGQARVVAAVSPAAVVFEMLTPEQADTARRADVADEQALGAALGWADSGWPAFSMYHPIFVAAGGAALYGAALPRETVRAAFADGPAGPFGPDASRYGLDKALPDAEQTAREAGQMAAHCDALPEDTLPGMVDAQRLRDAHFARVTLQALADTGGPVVLITGNGHARTDHGVPDAIATAAPGVSVVALGQLEAAPDGTPPYDHWLVTDAPDRPDPCAAFR